MIRRVVTLVFIALAAPAATATATEAATECPQQPAPHPLASTAPLPVGMTVIASEGLASPYFAALRPRSGAPMGVHLYVGYTDPNLPVRLAAIREYHAAGYQTLLTITAHSSDVALTPQVYSAYVTQVLAQAGSALNAVEITNEGNVPGSPETSDGSNPLIIDDLIAGVETAKQYARAHDPDLHVGFNWVFDYHLNLNAFWAQLKLQSTPQFLRSVDFLGLHTYPNTASLATTVNDTINTTEIDALQTARCEMSYLGLASSVPIDITEVGYPVPNSTYLATQADYWARVLDTIYAYRGNFGVRSMYVFRFPPASSASAADFGIVNPNGTPRPSYGVIRARIAKFDPAQIKPVKKPGALIRSATIRRGKLLVSVRARARVTVSVGGRKLRAFRAAPGRVYRIALHGRRGRVRVTALAGRQRQSVVVRR